MTPRRKKQDSSVLTLPEDLRIQTVTGLKDTWSAMEDVKEIDGTGVVEVDTAGLQLLLAFVNERAVNGVLVKWTGLSDKMKGVIEQLGMNEVFGQGTSQ